MILLRKMKVITMRIFINPGHCIGADPGACNLNGLQEAKVAMNVGKKVVDLLSAAGFDCNIHQEDSLSGICVASDNWNADLFVSIHCNAANQIARGTETYHCEGSTEGKKLASAIHKRIIKAIPTDYPYWDRGVKSAGYYVLRHTAYIAVLVEMAFIDNDVDAALLVDHENDFAKAIADGVCDYCGVKPPKIEVKEVEIEVPAVIMLILKRLQFWLESTNQTAIRLALLIILVISAAFLMVFINSQAMSVLSIISLNGFVIILITRLLIMGASLLNTRSILKVLLNNGKNSE